MTSHQTVFYTTIKDFMGRYPLAAIVALGTVIRLIFYAGTELGDDMAYLRYVHDLYIGNARLPTSHWESRFGLIIPVYVFTKLFGFNEYVTALYPFLCSLLNIVLIYKTTILLYDERIAVISGLLLSVFPLEVYSSTVVYPTVPLATMCGVCIYFIIRWKKNQKMLHCMAAGIFLGLAYLVHPTALYLLLFIIPFLLLFVHAQRAQGAIVFIIGLSLIFALEFGIYYAMGGSPFQRATIESQTVSQNRQAAGASEGDKGSTSFIKENREDQVLRGSSYWIEPVWTLTTQQEFGFYYYFIVPIAIYYLFKMRQDESTVIVLLWLIPIMLYLFYGSVSISAYSPLRRWPRYFTLVTAPALIILASMISQMITRNRRMLAGWVTLFLIVSSLGILTVDSRYRYAVVQRDVARYMKNHQGIYFAKGTYRNLSFFVDYDPAIVRKYDEKSMMETASSGTPTFIVYSEKDRESVVYPIVQTFDTPMTFSTKIARTLRMPEIVVKKLWRRDIYYIAKVV